MRTHCQTPVSRSTLRSNSGSGLSPMNTRRPGSRSSGSWLPSSSYMTNRSCHAPAGKARISSISMPIMRATASLA